MLTFTLDQNGWAQQKDYYDARKDDEYNKKIECLEKKRAAALAYENISFLIQQCESCSSLLNSVKTSTEDITENTVKKYLGRIDIFYSNCEGYKKQLEKLPERLMSIEEMYKKMADNHNYNYDVCYTRKIQAEEYGISAGYFNKVDEKTGEMIYGKYTGTLVDDLKDEMEGVTWVE